MGEYPIQVSAAGGATDFPSRNLKDTWPGSFKNPIARLTPTDIKALTGLGFRKGQTARLSFTRKQFVR